jgi:hypothetical protein
LSINFCCFKGRKGVFFSEGYGIGILLHSEEQYWGIRANLECLWLVVPEESSETREKQIGDSSPVKAKPNDFRLPGGRLIHKFPAMNYRAIFFSPCGTKNWQES